MTAAAASPAGFVDDARQNWRPFHLPNCSLAGHSGAAAEELLAVPIITAVAGSGHR